MKKKYIKQKFFYQNVVFLNQMFPCNTIVKLQYSDWHTHRQHVLSLKKLVIQKVHVKQNNNTYVMLYLFLFCFIL